MKKLNLSLVTVLAMSAFAVAGGDIVPVEPMVEAPVVMEAPSTGGFYAGIAYGMMDLELDRDNYGPDNDWNLQLEADTIMLQAGYKVNDFVAVEARYWAGLGDGDLVVDAHDRVTEGDNLFEADGISAWGIYVKPMYPVTQEFDVYALLGYANTDTSFNADEWDDGAFSWGIGADYSFSENTSVFVDYVSLYSDDEDGPGPGNGLEVDVYSMNFGVTYQF